MICKGFFFLGALKMTLLLMDKIRIHSNLYSELTPIFNHTIKFKIYFLSLLTLFVKALKMNNLWLFR